MFQLAFKVLISVRAKLFFGFCAMAVLIGLLGGYAYFSIQSAGHVVKDTFDKPLMAINYARSASQVFGQMELELQHQLTRLQTSEQGAEINIEFDAMQDLLDTLKSDLSVAQERSIAERAQSFFSDVNTHVDQWSALVFMTESYNSATFMSKIEELSTEIETNLDIIVELQTNESFRNREAALARMKKIEKYNLWATAAAAMLTVLLSGWLAITIINPLKAAANAARKISAGNLEAKIPRGGDDETGVLLKTMAAMQKNIRDRMSKEQDARALAQLRLAESLENSLDAIVLTDQDGKIIVANNQVKKMVPKLADENLISKPFDSFFDPNGRPKDPLCDFFIDRSEMLLSNGRWARINASETQEGGNLFIWTDITEMKDQNEKLREARDLAEEADKAKTLFLAAMSHELRTPLNAVIGFSDIIVSQAMGQVGNPKYTEMAALISQSGAHLLNIVEDVLQISHGGDSSELSADMTDVDLLDAINFCVKTIESEVKEASIQLSWERPDEDIYVRGDQNRLQQVFLNLLSNAIKFNKAGGLVKITIKPLQNNAVRIDIIDNGIGIDKADIARITEPFVQVDNSYKREYEGAGLGLSIVKQMVTLHNGGLAIRSEPGKGTCVSVAFPRLRASTQSVTRLSA